MLYWSSVGSEERLHVGGRGAFTSSRISSLDFCTRSASREDLGSSVTLPWTPPESRLSQFGPEERCKKHSEINNNKQMEINRSFTLKVKCGSSPILLSLLHETQICSHIFKCIAIYHNMANSVFDKSVRNLQTRHDFCLRHHFITKQAQMKQMDFRRLEYNHTNHMDNS